MRKDEGGNLGQNILLLAACFWVQQQLDIPGGRVSQAAQGRQAKQASRQLGNGALHQNCCKRILLPPVRANGADELSPVSHLGIRMHDPALYLSSVAIGTQSIIPFKCNK
eukprot:1159122-Pelagomonas_calceolata.AAC.5